MARYLCIKECYWASRHWDPNSPREQDYLYSGDKKPSPKLFRELGAAEVVPKAEEEGDKPIALSTAMKAGVSTPEAALAAADAQTPQQQPVVDGAEVSTEEDTKVLEAIRTEDTTEGGQAEAFG